MFMATGKLTSSNMNPILLDCDMPNDDEVDPFNMDFMEKEPDYTYNF